MNFQSPQHDGGSSYHSPAQQPSQAHQDSGVSFSTPSGQDQSNMFNNSPQDSGLLYQDSKMYSSPGQMHQLPEDQQLFQNSPGSGFDMQSQQMFYVDPNSLGQ